MTITRVVPQLLTIPQVLDEGMADDDYPGGTVSLQPSHGSKPGFEAPVVGLQRVVGMDLGVMEGLREQLVEHYNRARPHRGIGRAVPHGPSSPPSPVEPNDVRRRDILGGLIHEYHGAAA